jgi:hypothetical protein
LFPDGYVTLDIALQALHWFNSEKNERTGHCRLQAGGRVLSGLSAVSLEQGLSAKKLM